MSQMNRADPDFAISLDQSISSFQVFTQLILLQANFKDATFQRFCKMT